MQRMMSWGITPLFLCAILISMAWGANPQFNASQTFEFDPDHTRCPVAFWRQGFGEKDRNCRNTFGLHLEKNCSLDTNASAGAVLNGLKGVVVQAGDELDYDLKNDSPCGAGSPRFNVAWSLDGASNFSFVGGCSNGTPSAAEQSGWTRWSFGLQVIGQAFPPIPASATIESVVLIVDEPGVYNLDNISFRDQFADAPGNSGPVPVCP